MVQTSYAAAPAKGYPGQIVDRDPDPAGIISCIVDRAGGTVAPGLFVLRTDAGDYCASPVPDTAVVADDDAIMTALATSASIQTLDTEANGVIALTKISPPRKITVTRDNHVDHDAVTLVLTGLDQDGVPVSENLAGTNGGNETLTSVNYYSYFVSLVIPAQAGTGGTTKIGLSASASLDGFDVLGVSVRSQKALATPSSSDNEAYEDEDTMPVLRRGRIWMTCETAFRAGDVPLVRLIVTGSEVYGKIRAESTDSGDAFPVRSARILNSGSAGELALVAVNL